MASGQTAGGKFFGNYLPAIVTGLVFNDADGDGVKDAGEAGLAGVTMFVDENNNGALDAGERTCVTRSNGAYTLAMKPGTHTVREVVPARVALPERLDPGGICGEPIERRVIRWPSGHESSFDARSWDTRRPSGSQAIVDTPTSCIRWASASNVRCASVSVSTVRRRGGLPSSAYARARPPGDQARVKTRPSARATSVNGPSGPAATER